MDAITTAAVVTASLGADAGSLGLKTVQKRWRTEEFAGGVSRDAEDLFDKEDG